MLLSPRSSLLVSVAAGVMTLGVVFCMERPATPTGAPNPKAANAKGVAGYWEVDEVRPGMKGYGRTVIRGTRIETFQAEVLGVLRSTSPGRDMVLCRLSGLGLEKSGVIAGMSGSPVYIDNKLLGAVAYGWSYGKEPIAGITPFTQMHSFVESYERRDLAEEGKPQRVGRHSLSAPIRVGSRTFESVAVSQDPEDQRGRGDDALWMKPLRTPLAATGFSENSLSLMRDLLRGHGLVPLQGGGVGAKVAEANKNVPLEPGAPLAVTLIRGDFDMSGIGTVTHVEGNRVYGWGHPFMGLGACEFPLMTGYIHTVYPRQSVSFKMGSPLNTVGVINADVSTCIAGWLGREPDLLPVKMTVSRGPNSPSRTFNVEVVRQRSLMSSLVYTALTNSVDMEGELPEELTAEFKATLELEGREPIVIKDTFSGFSGGRAPSALYSQVSSVISQLIHNPYQPLRIERIECDTRILPGRRTADIDAVEVESEFYAPGETVRATVFLRPYKGQRERMRVGLDLPADMPEGGYTATLSDEQSAVLRDIRDNPVLDTPENVAQVLESLRVQLDAKRTNLAIRVPLGASGVAVDGKALPDLPGSMVEILGHSRRSGAQTMRSALAEHYPTNWVIKGRQAFSFTVTKNKKLTPMP